MISPAAPSGFWTRAGGVPQWLRRKVSLEATQVICCNDFQRIRAVLGGATLK
jgi:hypothetical protein